MRIIYLIVFIASLLAPHILLGDEISGPSDTVSSDTTIITQIFDLFTEDEKGIIPEIQRSRRKQVNQLLIAILEQPGQLQLSGVATLSLQTELEKNPTYLGVGSFDIFAFTSFGKNALLFFDFEAIGGRGPDVSIPNVSGLNGDAGSEIGVDSTDRVTVLEAWTEFKVLRDIFTVTLGKIDLSNYFDSNLHANDETSQFISTVFINNPVIPFGMNGPGILLRTALLHKFYIQFGLSKADIFDRDLMTGHFKIIETGFKLLPATGWEANYRIYGFEHPFSGHSRGFGVSADHMLANHFHIFGRYAKNEAGLGEWYGIKEAWSAGLGFKQVFLHREFKIGMAYAETYSWANMIPEQLVEVYFNSQLNNWVFISPHFQWLKNNNPPKKEYFITGIRMNFMY